MRSGIAYGMDVHWFNQSSGLGGGIKITGHHYYASLDGLTDKVNTFYVGPSMLWRNFDRKNRNAFIFGLSLGYLNWNEKVNAGGYSDSASLSERGFGTSAEIGYDIRIGRNAFVGITLGFTGGSVNIIDNETESLSAVEVGVGLRF